ncbi:zinc-binding protein A33-like [Scyliorhinus canicula]|uniref:zinc-binding protein A33-like n=1 Tax=Scyliorhinus canicula TaxID=7830 RepID=UPI0018F753F1|nr:zinc-binding protein A33-like [Scyliorhinus canicula]XP_038671398.1 zinc-binding protein A33-like [Scyliorhinus canicula]XP_038671399.1 zinc-binding protein A33-like [Scyliorhinus canicula]XP_038671400.1 zinc-binding protein A33-like [Scyliorhinus canicula]
MATVNRLFSEVTCSICLDFFQEPVTLECEHNFCRLCISRSWEQGNAFYSCPECREGFREKKMKPNRMLANIVEGVRELKLQPHQDNPAFYCQQHEERRKLFCQDCQGAICVVCSCAKEHQGHIFIPIEEAAVVYKGKLEQAINFLESQKEQVCQSQSQEEAKICQIKEQGTMLKERVEADMVTIYQFLDAKKQELEWQIDEEVCRTIEPLQENLAKIHQETSTIEQAILDVRLQLSLTEPLELLQDIKLLLERCKQERVKPADVPTALHTDSIITPFRFIKIWDELKALVPAREFLTLDPKTAHPRLILSEDLISVIDGEKRRDCSLMTHRFNHWLCVLASSGFLSGQHYWDVELGNNSSCVLGVASGSADRLITKQLTPQDGYWVIEMLNGSLVNLSVPGARTLPLRRKPRTIRIYLNYEEGQLSFYDAHDLCPIYTIRDKFTTKLYPLFNPHNKKEGNSEPLCLLNSEGCLD